MFYPLLIAIVLFFVMIFYCLFIWDSIISNCRKKYIDVPTSRKARNNIKLILNDLGAKEGTFYDLGSGHGTMALAIKKAFPQMQVYGFDRSTLKIIFSKARASFLRTRVIFQRKDILTVDTGKADIIYTYIWHTTMPKMKEKFERELKKETLIISNTFPIPDWEPILTKETLTIKRDPGFERIYVYRR